jgi:hypothetical protein
LCSRLTQPPAHSTHSRKKRKRKVCITGFLTQSSNKGQWLATARRSLGGEALIGLGKTMSMRKCGVTQRELTEGTTQRFSRERDGGTQRFSNEKNGLNFKSLRINNDFYQKTVVVYGELATVF